MTDEQGTIETLINDLIACVVDETRAEYWEESRRVKFAAGTAKAKTALLKALTPPPPPQGVGVPGGLADEARRLARFILNIGPTGVLARDHQTVYETMVLLANNVQRQLAALQQPPQASEPTVPLLPVEEATRLLGKVRQIIDLDPDKPIGPCIPNASYKIAQVAALFVRLQQPPQAPGQVTVEVPQISEERLLRLETCVRVARSHLVAAGMEMADQDLEWLANLRKALAGGGTDGQ